MDILRSFDRRKPIKIVWNHYGKVYCLKFDKKQYESKNLYELLIKKVVNKQPKFNEQLAYCDPQGNKVIIDNNTTLYEALEKSYNFLIIYTMSNNFNPQKEKRQSNPSFLRNYYFPPQRSSSLPPPLSPTTSIDTNSTLSMDGVSYAQKNQTKCDKATDDAELLPARKATNASLLIRPASKSTLRSGTSSTLPRYHMYNEYYGQSHYTQPLLYGFPPHNLLLAEFLSRGHFPHIFMNPLLSPMTSHRWIGPNKYHNYNRNPFIFGFW